MTGNLIIPGTFISSATSEPIETPKGFTLVSVIMPELTSTSFTITSSTSITGTYVTLKDPLGIYATAAGDPVTFTMGSTSLGNFVILPVLSASLGAWIKIVLSGSESAGMSLTFKSIA